MKRNFAEEVAKLLGRVWKWQIFWQRRNDVVEIESETGGNQDDNVSSLRACLVVAVPSRFGGNCEMEINVKPYGGRCDS